MKKHFTSYTLLFVITIFLSGCTHTTPSTNTSTPSSTSNNKTWSELRQEAATTIKDFELLNTTLNTNTETNCSGDCFVYTPAPGDYVGEYPQQSGAYSIYTYTYGQGGGASAIFQLHFPKNAEPYYEVILGGIQDTISCDTLDKKSIPTDLVTQCVTKSGETIDRT